jgi:hypothetical protein
MVIGEYMKKALVDTQVSVEHIVAYENNNPVYETYANSARVCEVVNTEFPVYETLIWVDCEDNVVADQFWYDTQSKTIKPIENAPQPEPVQPIVESIESV